MNFFGLLLPCLIFLIISFAAMMSSIKYIHIFQLNSYAHDTQKRWFLNNTHRLVPNIIFFILGILAYWLNPILLIPIFAAAAFLNRYKKAKKTIVYTARVKRLIATITIITLLPAALFIFDIKLPYLISVVLYLLNPFITVLADSINSPIEKGIKRYYINDAKRLLSDSNANVIGVTGSYGKTSVKYYLNSLMSSQFDTLMTPESYNTPMGVVITIRNKLNARHKYFICEMGARRVGDIKELCDIVHPKYGIITSVGPQHLETFGSMENIVGTKFELADAVLNDGILFANGDNKYIQSKIKTYGTDKKIITYGSGKTNDFKYEILSVSSRGTEFKIISRHGEFTYKTKLLGSHCALNITGAVAVCVTLGIAPEKLSLPISRLESVPHRMQLTDNGSAIIIDDAYNSNPAGAKAALDTLALFEEYKILITPGMVELGDKQYECNKEFGTYAAAVCDYIILVGQKQAVPILDGMGDFPKDRYFVADTVNEAIEHAYGLHVAGRKKVILLENDLPDNYLS